MLLARSYSAFTSRGKIRRRGPDEAAAVALAFQQFPAFHRLGQCSGASILRERPNSSSCVRNVVGRAKRLRVRVMH